MDGLLVVLRSYNRPSLPMVMERLASTGRVASFVVIVNAREDRLDSVVLARRANVPVPVVAIALSDYGWSRALNAGIASAPPRATLMLAVSHEVHVHRHHLEGMIAAAATPGSSCAYARFTGRGSASYRVPRNTLCLWRLAVLRTAGGFDERTDERGGMEDYELALRLFASRGLLPRLGARDVVIDRPEPEAHRAKCRRELAAMRRIDEGYAPAVVASLRRALKTQDVG